MYRFVRFETQKCIKIVSKLYQNCSIIRNQVIMNEKIDQLGNKLSIVPLSDVTSVTGNNFTLSSNKNFRTLYTLNDLNFEQKPNTGDAGELYAQSLIANVRINNELIRFANQDLMIVMYTMNDKQVLWGSKDFPVRIKITPLVSSFNLDLSRSVPYPLVF